MVTKTPTSARYFYFHVDNSSEIKSVWNQLGARNKIKVDENQTDRIEPARKSHGLTKVTSAGNSNARFSIYLFKNIVMILGVFFDEGPVSELRDRIRYDDLKDINVAIGGATIIISKKNRFKKLINEFNGKYTEIKGKVGTLFQFEEREGEKEHFYFFHFLSDMGELDHFLSLHFPLFDFAIHKLHMERDYFKNQRKWIIKEKEEIDYVVGEILHKRIIGETLDPSYIGALEKEVDALSTKYALLVNDGHLIRKARTTLEIEIDSVYMYLEKFAGLESDSGLRILKNSIDLKKKLFDDEISMSNAIKNTKTAIDIVRINVDLLRSRENIFLQEEAISFQVAAGVLEFIIVYYYSLTSWMHLIGEPRFEEIPVPIRFITMFLFASFSVGFTHFIGESFREKWKLNKGMFITAALLLIIFIYVVYLSIQTGNLHPSELSH